MFMRQSLRVHGHPTGDPVHPFLDVTADDEYGAAGDRSKRVEQVREDAIHSPSRRIVEIAKSVGLVDEGRIERHEDDHVEPVERRRDPWTRNSTLTGPPISAERIACA